MKTFLTLVIALFCFTADAQKCKFNYDEVDKMTDARVQRIDLKSSRFHFISFYRSGDNLQISETITYGGEKNENIQKGSTLKIKLHNGEFLELKSTNNAAPVSYAYEGAIYSRYVVEYAVDEAPLKAIAEHGFTVFSFQPVGSISGTFELKPKSIKKVNQAAKCILGES